MRARTASRLAWSLCGLSLGLIVCTLALAVLDGADVQGVSFPVALTASALVGGLVASRRPENPVGWFFLGAAACFTLTGVAAEYVAFGLAGGRTMAWLMGWLWVPAVVLLLCFVPLYFPDGRLVSPRWRWLVRFALFFSVGATVFSAFRPGEIQEEGVVNPLGIEGLQPFLGLLDTLVFGMYFALLFASAASLVVRFRRSGSVERQQIKWLALAAVLIPVWFLTNAPIQAAAPNLFLVLDSFFFSAMIPLAAGIAILRYRLYDIDVIINRALVYAVLTAALALVYFGGIAVLQGLFRALTGQESSLAVVASTLAIAALFSPLRRRIQAFIDWRFYRNKYDARKTLETFSAKLREETDLDRLGDDLVSVARETVQPEHARLWLRPPHEASGVRQRSGPDG
ncbi:MAG: hypothetical protein M3522_14445 [Actinomycetota bacterium]|nr:hypothetical protein [Actinomycetota bacterium]